MVRRRVRIRFHKTGDGRLLGHLDLVRAWERLFRRAGLPLVMSEGCHSRPRISFPSALPLGEAGCDEVVEVDYEGDMTRAEVQAALVRCAPASLAVASVDELSPGQSTAELRESVYEVPLPDDRRDAVAAGVARLLAEPTFRVTPRTGPDIDVRDQLLTAEVAGNVLRFRLRAARGRNLRAREVLVALGLDDLIALGLYPTRTQVVLQ